MDAFSSDMYRQPDMDLQPIMWDSVIDQHMITNYNQLLNQSDFFGGMGVSGPTSPGSESTTSSTSPARSSSISSTKVMTEHRGSIPDKVERRREQNRQSQRAYRDRKEKHQRELEGQIAVWKDKHDALTKSCAAQTETIAQLKAQVEQLNSQVLSLSQPNLPDVWGQVDQPQQDFDLVPFYDKKSGTWARQLKQS